MIRSDYLIEINNVYNEDCIEFMKKLPDECVDLIIADPPYNILINTIRGQTEKWDNIWETYNEYLKWFDTWVKESYRILKHGGVMYCYHAPTYIRYIQPILENYYILQNLIVWHYRNISLGTKLGSTGNCYMKKWDVVYYVSKGKPKISVRKKFSRYGDDNFDVWIIPGVQKNYKEYVGHPTQKPLAISEKIVKASSMEGDLVYIPFAGSGSEIVACIRNKRNWIATEINKQYIDEIIIPRINKI